MCVYTSPLPGSPHIPSTKQKAAGIFNLKIVKMHGSASWLRCPSSNHIYTGLGMNESSFDIYVKRRRSPFIERTWDQREDSQPAILEPYIITPTYSKVFDLPHIQTAWHNAYVELREADNIVIIGYSLPEADYHFRTLLRRAIRPNSRMTVVLSPHDDPSQGSGFNSPAHRYRQVFREEQLALRYDGAEGYIQDLIGQQTVQSLIKGICE